MREEDQIGIIMVSVDEYNIDYLWMKVDGLSSSNEVLCPLRQIIADS